MSEIKVDNITDIVNEITLIDDIFEKIAKKMIVSEEELVFMLATAILFISEYNDKNRNEYIEFAYYLILEYSRLTGDLIPLYDFATNFGFYPISYEILKNNIVSIEESITKLKLEKLKIDNLIPTKEQSETFNEVLRNENNKIAFIAPTSFGKSSLIINDIKNNEYEKIGIIVPSKSLINQVYKDVRNKKLKYKIITHDEMYENEENFIGILTQERALRMMKNHNIKFDILYVDEAHKILFNDSRNILLTRLLNKANKLNSKLKTIYLSPLVENADNLKLLHDTEIFCSRINYNIKEVKFFEFAKNNKLFSYNRFNNKYYNTDLSYSDWCEYVISNSKEKNFIFHKTPKKVQMIANELKLSLRKIENDKEIDEIKNTLQQQVGVEYYITELIEYGIIYLHGLIPDKIKNYLERKFKEVKSIKYLVANSVVLEGINFPVDNLFVMSTYSVSNNDLINLIGRVNRLNMIFGKGVKSLEKLFSTVHFIDTDKYYFRGRTMRKCISGLRMQKIVDIIANPLLQNYDEKAYVNKKSVNAKANAIKVNKQIVELENYLTLESTDEAVKIKKMLIENGFSEFFIVNDLNINAIINNIRICKEQLKGLNSVDMFQRIKLVFFSNEDPKSNLLEIKYLDFAIGRLQEEKAMKYYIDFIDHSSSSLKQKINYQIKRFARIKSQVDSCMYVGTKFGEISKPSKNYNNSHRNVYVDLNYKNYNEMVNLAIIKLKMEEDFVGYKLEKFVSIMCDFELIDRSEYEFFKYGTSDKKKIKYIKSGLSLYLINKLEIDNQLMNLKFDEYNNLVGNEKFIDYYKTLDALTQNELDKLI